MFLVPLVACEADPPSGDLDDSSPPTELKACPPTSVCTYWAPVPGAVTTLQEIVEIDIESFNFYDGPRANAYVEYVDVGMLGGSPVVASALQLLALISGHERITTVGPETGVVIESDITFGDSLWTLSQSAYSAVVLPDQVLFTGGPAAVLSVDIDGRIAREVATSWQTIVPPSLMPPDSYCVPSSTVEALAQDGDGRLYYRNHAGIYRLNEDWSVATLLAFLCVDNARRFAVSNDGSTAYVLTELGILAADLADGTVSTFVDVAVLPSAPWRFVYGWDIAIHPRTGEVYITSEQCCAHRCPTSGTCEVYAGNCDMCGIDGDGGPPEDALFMGLGSIAIDDNENVFLADLMAGRIRVVLSPDGLTGFD